MLKLSTAAGLMISLLSCYVPFSQAPSPQAHPREAAPHPFTMTSIPTIPMKLSAPEAASIQAVTLIARQQDLAPIGREPSLTRPTGFASIFLTLENPSDRPQRLELLQVAVVTVDRDVDRHIDHQDIQLSTREAQTIQLKPLEKAVLDIQLSSREGYATTGTVKAIATYRINDTIQAVESPGVEIR